jgi:hypothetical protein
MNKESGSQKREEWSRWKCISTEEDHNRNEDIGEN